MKTLFSRAVQTFSLVAATLILSFGLSAGKADAQYRVQTGDQLSVEVLEDPSLNRNVLVLPDGTISFPFAGTIQAAGRSVRSIESLLSRSLAENFATEPNVFVNVVGLVQSADELAAQPYGIFLMGEVNNPGRLNINDDEDITLLQAIAQAGGFTRFAATKRIELRRPSANGEQIFTFNYKKGTGISGATLLKSGDVVNVPERRLFE